MDEARPVVRVSALCSFSAGWAAGRTPKHVSLSPKSSLPEQVERKTTKREPVNLENGHQNGDDGDNMIALWHTELIIYDKFRHYQVWC